MPKVVGNADGYVIIDTKIRTGGMTKGIENAKSQFVGLANSAGQASQQIEASLTGSFSRPVAMAQLQVKTLEDRLATLSYKFSEALAADDDKGAARLYAQMEKTYDKIEAARERLRIEVAQEAKKQSAAEEKEAKKTQRAHTKANASSEKETKKSTKTMGRFGTRLSGIAMSAFLFNSLSSGFRDISEYITGAITSADGMRQALANLKGAAAQAAAPIIQALTPALTSLANAAATAMSYVAQLMSAFTGKSMQQVSDSAKAFDKTSKAAGKLSRSVAGFDQLTKLQDNSGGSNGDIAANYDYVAESVGFLDQVKNAILNGDWIGAGEILGQKITEMFENINWQKVGKTIGNILGGLFSFALGLALNVDPFALIGSINGIVSGLFQSISGAIQNLNWMEIGAKLVKFLLLGLLMADPATAIITILMSPNGAELMSGAAELVGSIVAALIRAILGSGKEIGRLAAELWKSIKDHFDQYVDWEGTPGQIIGGLLRGIGAALKNVGAWIKENIFKPFLDGFRKAFDINSPSKVMEREGGYIMQGLFNGLLGGIARLGEICKEIWDTITGAFSNVGQWFSDTFSNAWENVLAVFSGDSDIFGGIKAGMEYTFKEIVNDLISGFNTVIRNPFNKLNSMLNTIRGWEVLGQTPFQGLWNYNPISVPQIPYLAKGAVIPPNAPFMAVLGDQRHGTNIEAPLSTIQEAVAKVMEDYYAANMAGHSAIVAVLREILEAVLGIEIGDDVIAKAVQRQNSKMAIVRGG